MHNDLFHYSRKMYWEFCCLVPEVQNLILEYCNLDLQMRKEDGLFDRCIAAFFRDPSTRVYREGATFGDILRFTSSTSTGSAPTFLSFSRPA